MSALSDFSLGSLARIAELQDDLKTLTDATRAFRRKANGHRAWIHRHGEKAVESMQDENGDPLDGAGIAITSIECLDYPDFDDVTESAVDAFNGTRRPLADLRKQIEDL